MDTLLQEIRYAFRMLVKSPVFTGAAVVTLALGIGANTTIFSFVNALLLKGVPGVDMDGLVGIYTVRSTSASVTSYMDYVDFRDQNETLSGLAAYKPRLMDLATGGVTERVEGDLVTGNYFEVLGVEPAAGRFFLPEEDSVPDTHTVAVISHSLWQTRFNGDPGAVGADVLLNGRQFTVVGVAPPGFRGTRLLDRPQIYVPMMMQAHFMPESGYLLDRRGWGGILLVGRLLPGVALGEAQANLDAIGERLETEYPNTNSGRSYLALSLRQATLPPAARSVATRFSALLLGVVVLVLLIACVNVANLMLARSEKRRREMAVRQALGAPRGRVVRQLLVESLLLALLGGGLGLLLAAWASEGLALVELPVHLDFGVDPRVLAFTFGVSVIASLAFGLAPAFQTARLDLTTALKQETGELGLKRGLRLSHVLVAGQVALSLVLLVTAGLFTRTLLNLVGTEPGFATERTLAVTLDPALEGYDADGVNSFYERLMDRVARLPGVERATLVSALPGPLNDNVSSFDVEGFPRPADGPPVIGFGAVGRDYFRTLEINVIQGREFNDTDRADSLPVAVVNLAAARHLRQLTGRDALGLQLSTSGPDGPYMEVIGVAADSRLASLRDEAHPFLYYFQPQVVPRGFGSKMTLVMRTYGEPLSVAPVLRSEVAALDPNVPLFDVTTLEEHLSTLLFQERLGVTILSLSAFLALALAAVGLYGVLAYAVSRRSRELGLRMALGASRRDLLTLVVRQGMTLALAGLGAGLLSALAASRLLSGFLYGTSDTDPATFVLVSLLLLVVSFLASYTPARGATRVNPLQVLREE